VKTRAKLSHELTAQLEVRLLGPLEVSSQGREVPTGGPKPRALLAALALEAGRVVSVDRLVESLWPGEPPDTAGHAVQVYVSQLRKTLGEGAISTRPPGYAFEPDPGSVDVHRFVRLAGEGREALGGSDAAGASSVLREALALWRGPALADFTYEPFAQTEIARLEDLRAVAVEDRIEADLALGRHAELVSELEALVESQPLRERPRGQLMLALYRSGRQADALAAYRAARETLVEELGIDPGPALRELEAAILRQDEALLPPKGAVAAPAMQFRRLVSVLFVDVVESMALADTLDAEALGRVLSSYFEAVSAVLTRHGGTVEKYAGDAVMAVFGIPVSHEDDALRAARAALDIRTAIAALNKRLGVRLEIRIGVESGEVVTTPSDTRQRLVTGEAVGIAARLEESAAADEIVVGEVAARLIDHAARLAPLGALAIKGKREAVRAFRLVEIETIAPAFARHLDASLVGRKRELAALRKLLKQAVDGSAVRVAVVVGSPGVGKSRLAAELARRARGATARFGRCLAYGEGITYWPLREVVETAEGQERDAILAALEADTPPPASEIALLFRHLCESLARDRPLIVVFDDVHWAEPTFLELVEHLADKGVGPILVVCVAREDLVHERPTFLEGRDNAQRIVLDALSGDDADALLEGLGGAILESDQRARIVEAAEGNPLFLEQLLALALEGGLAGRPLPETVQALLAARLDRLGPGERAVLERGAVVGKEFTADDVVSLLDAEAAPTVDSHLGTLAARGFIRPRGEGGLAFRHGLVQEAVYRAAPKRLRAELHERFADRLDRTYADLPELDEFVGHHLEMAYRFRTELGESDRRTARLAEDSGRRLGHAGIRAWKRVDIHATTNLLERSTSLLPTDEPVRLEYLCELALALRTFGDAPAAAYVVADVIDSSRKAGNRRLELRARIEGEYLRLLQDPRSTADELLAATREGIPMFESVGDERALGRAWLLDGFVQGGLRANYKTWEESAERALEHYKNANWPTSTCVGEIAAALYYGPTPVPVGIARCEQLRQREVSDRVGEANVGVFYGGLLAQRGDIDEARRSIAAARETFADIGQRTAAAIRCSAVLGDVELLAGNAETAADVLRDLCDELVLLGDSSHLASRAGDLAEALYVSGRLDEAHEWSRIAEQHTAADDVDARIRWLPVRAKIAARRASEVGALALAHEAVNLAESSDGLNRRAKAYSDLAEVLHRAERAEAATAFAEALSLYELKGNLVGVAQVRALSADRALV
jgi:DNA-binding SARP family transcriptional activator